MTAPTLNYQGIHVGIPTGDPSLRQLSAARLLRFWALMLVLLGILLAVVLIDTFVVERYAAWVPIDPRDNLIDLHLSYSYGIAWRNLLYIAPLLGCPAAIAIVYLVLARRLSQRAADRGMLMLVVLLTMLHTLAAVACTLLFLIGGAIASFGVLTWRSPINIALCLLAVLMVPGMFWTCIRFMDLLQTRVVRPRPAVSPPAPAPGGD